MVRFVIVRHGLSIYNKERKFTGQSDIPLDEIGFEQAQNTANYILKNYKIDKIYSSDSKKIENKINLNIEKFTEAFVSETTWAKDDLREKTKSYFLVTHSPARPFLIKNKPIISQRAKAQSSSTDPFIIEDVLNININNNIDYQALI